MCVFSGVCVEAVVVKRGVGVVRKNEALSPSKISSGTTMLGNQFFCNMIGPMFANFLVLYFVAMRHVYYGLYFRICVRCEGVGLGGAKAELPVRKSWVFWVC